MIDILCDALAEMAGADPLLHRRGILAGVPAGRRALGPSDGLSQRCSRPGATSRSPRNGGRSAASAPSSPARWKSSARRRRIGASLEADPQVFIADSSLARGARRRRFRRSLHHLGHRDRRRRAARGRLHAARGAGRRRRQPPRSRPEMRALLADFASGRHGSRISRRHPARRAGAARIARARPLAVSFSPTADPVPRRAAASSASRSRLLVLAADQASKFWAIGLLDGPDRPSFALTPFLTLVMSWNRGIAYTLLRSDGDFGRFALAGSRPGGGRPAVVLAVARARARLDAGVRLPDRRRARQRQRPAGSWRGGGLPLFPHALFDGAAVELCFQPRGRGNICRRRPAGV